MVTNSTTPLTSISAIRKGQKTSATSLNHQKIIGIMSSNNNNNPPLCPYPRRGIIDCSNNNNNTTNPSGVEIDSPESLNCGLAEDSQGNAAVSDFERIAKCVNRLEASGWYYGRLNWEEATNLLKTTPVGTFLVRDSCYPACLFALSVQTEYGPTSIRIHYVNGQFKLDAEETIACRMPLFDCAVRLIDYYVWVSLTDKRNAHVFLDETGKRDRPIFLDKPLYHSVASLQHVCRLSVNRHLSSTINRIYLPKSVKEYLTEYPYIK